MSYLLLFLGGVIIGYLLARYVLTRRRHYTPHLDFYPAALRDVDIEGRNDP
jgi:hypothetical protein